MAKICYAEKRLGTKSMRLVELCNTIVAQYQQQGYDLTLRQVYYQLVAAGHIPNKVEEYDRLGRVLSDARLAGLVDWNALTDRTRNLRGAGHWDDPAQIMRGAANGFRLDKWDNQPYRVEVWVEKDALVGVLERACTALDINYFSCRGYTSQSEMHAAALRLKGYQEAGQRPVVLHLGDHDPSGKDMTRDIVDRLEMFTAYYAPDPDLALVVERIALNMDQVHQYNPPPNPAKMTDSRYKDYMAEFGASSWELDALRPTVIGDLITLHALEYRDEDKWNEREEEETTHRRQLRAIANRWPEVVERMGV